MNESLAQLASDMEATTPDSPTQFTVLVRTKKWVAVYRDDDPTAAFARAMSQHEADHAAGKENVGAAVLEM